MRDKDGCIDIPAGRTGFESIISVAFSTPRMLLPGGRALLDLDIVGETRCGGSRDKVHRVGLGTEWG